MKQIKLLTIQFENEILPYEIPLFRGAVNAALEEQHSILFHNHTEEGLRYSYPLIQYKRIGKKAAIVCLEEGTEAIGEFFNSEPMQLSLGEKEIQLTVENIKADKINVQVWQTSFCYRIKNWLPLNSKNFKTYIEEDSLAEKMKMLEKILIGNMLSFLKGLDIHIEDQITCSITSLSNSRLIKYKGVKKMAFDAEFKTNMSLPNFIGLGKDASVGFGVVSRKINKTSKIQNTDEKEQ